MIALGSALGVFVFVALAEWLHARRIRVTEKLAFGPAGVRAWTRWVWLMRSVSVAAFTWGLITIIVLKVGNRDDSKAKKDREATRLVFVGDLSPSMYLKDAGPDGTQTRQERMHDVVDAILQRVSGNLRFGMIAFYTDSLQVIENARDPELVRNVFNGLPLFYAMPEGQTDLGKAVNDTLAQVADYPEESTRMIILTDGDSVSLVPIAPRPKSVKDVMVLGLGHPTKGSYIDGHQSRQEGDTLRRLALDLGGRYTDVNTQHLSTAALGDLVVPLPPLRRGLDLEELAALAMAIGALIHALLPLVLERFGTSWKIAPVKSTSGELRATQA